MTSTASSLHCLFCGSASVLPAAFPRPTVFNNKTFRYRRCTACDLVFIDPLPSPEDYAKMYGLDYHEEFYFKESPDYENFYRLLESRETNRRMLDFGCGDGSFLRFFQQRGYTCAGLEFNPGLVVKLKDMYTDMRFGHVEELDDLLTTFRPGIVYMGDVLEHLTQPLQFLRSLYSKLEPGAFLLVQGPAENNSSLSLSFRKLISKLKGRQPAHHVPYHITFSNASNQRAVFELSGFQTVYFRLNETAWPMPARLSMSPGKALQWAVGQVSMIVSSMNRENFGNRFVFLGRKDKPA